MVCKDCQLEIKVDDLEEHKIKCDKAEASCPWCGLKATNEKIKKHIDKDECE